MKRSPGRTTAISLSILTLMGCMRDENPTQPLTTEEGTAPSFAVAANSWTSKAQMPTGRQWLTAGVINNSAGQPILYAIGGSISGRSVTKVEAYNFATNTWSTKAPLPRALSETHGAGVIGGKLYVSGGVQFNDPEAEFPFVSRDLYVYNPSTNTWTKKADMPWASSDGVTGVINNKLYVLVGDCWNDHECGGARGGDRRLLRYDPVTNTWDSSLPSAPSQHFGGGVGCVINGKFYVSGGRSSQLDVYDPATNTWTTKAPLPSPVVDAASAVASNRCYVIGGRDGPFGATVRTVRMYNPVNNTWNTRAPMPTARSRLAAARAVLNGRSHIIAVGGAPGSSRANEVYTP
jgi:N-acetylneuraminic acid mutarotase